LHYNYIDLNLRKYEREDRVMKKLFSYVVSVCILLSLFFCVPTYAKSNNKIFYGNKEENIDGLKYKINENLYKRDISDEDITGYIYQFGKKKSSVPRLCILVDKKKEDTTSICYSKKTAKNYVKSFSKGTKLGKYSNLKIKKLRHDNNINIFNARFSLGKKYNANLYMIATARGFITLVSYRESSDTKNYQIKDVYQSIDVDSYLLANSNISKLSADYTGSKVAGTTIDDNNYSLHLYANTDDNRTITIPHNMWSIENPQTLQADQSYTFNIKYTNQGKEMDTSIDIACSTISPEKLEADFKAKCEKPSYEDLMRNPDAFKSHNIALTGEVMQVQDDVLLVQVTQDEYGFWTDIVMVYDFRINSNTNILEDDIITLYGSYQGTTDYETVMGAQKTVPLVSADYIDIN
jgi:hypothetical protein